MARIEAKERPAAVVALREQIERWRRVRRGGDAMPAELWAAAVALARGEHTISQVSRWLPVDYGALKRRVETAEAEATEAAEMKRDESSGATVARVESAPLDARVPVSHSVYDEDETDALRFVELSGESLFGASAASECVVEVVSADGARMTIRQPAGAELDVVGLTASFWRRSPCCR